MVKFIKFIRRVQHVRTANNLTIEIHYDFTSKEVIIIAKE